MGHEFDFPIKADEDEQSDTSLPQDYLMQSSQERIRLKSGTWTQRGLTNGTTTRLDEYNTGGHIEHSTTVTTV